MKIVLDEMMPRQFAASLGDHEVDHVVSLGWSHIVNGKLLSLCQNAGFEAFITKDSGLPFQQNLKGRTIAIIVLKTKTQNFDELIALAPQILSLVATLKPGSVTQVP